MNSRPSRRRRAAPRETLAAVFLAIALAEAAGADPGIGPRTGTEGSATPTGALAALVEGASASTESAETGERADLYDSAAALAYAKGILDAGLVLESMTVFQDVGRRSRVREERAEALQWTGDVMSLYLARYEEAIARYRRVLADYGDTAMAEQALFNLAMCSRQIGDDGAALDAFRAFLDRYPASIRVETARFMAGFLERNGVAASGSLPPAEPLSGEATREEPAGIRWGRGTALPADSEIRVSLGMLGTSVEMSSPAGVRLEPEPGPPGAAGAPIVVRATGRELAIEGSTWRGQRLTARAGDGETICLGGRCYRDRLLLRVRGGRIEAVNVLPIESYLRGVLPMEVPASWNPEALKAQAVAARTYAYFQKSHKGVGDHDVSSNEASQVYGGASVETAPTTKAVEETRAEILTFGDQPLLACFHADGGGHTEAAAEVWATPYPYLAGVADPNPPGPGAGTAGESGRRWRLDLAFAEIEEKLAAAGYRVRGLSGLTVVDRSPSGRARTVVLAHPSGSVDIRGNQLRILLGPEKLRSTLFDVSPIPGGVRLEGRGFGHGVGLSQRGAQALARAGESYRAILAHYYAGATLVKLD